MYNHTPTLSTRDDDLRADFARLGVVGPPASFTLNDCTSVPAEYIFEWSGPGHRAATWEIKTQRNDEEGLTYFIDRDDNKPWTPSEIDAMQATLAELLAGIEWTEK